MAKNIIIVESPAKAKTITRFFDKEYIVLASMGHVRDLPSKELGFDPQSDFEPKYEIMQSKRKVIQSIKKEIKADSKILLATDEDREGESISWHLVAALKLKKQPIERIVFHEITKSAISHALAHPRKIDTNLVNAQQARRILDRAVGYKLSPLLWKKIKPGLSAGRVQSVAVRIIVEREREIRSFVPEEYWRIKTQFQHPEFLAELTKIHGKTSKVKNEQEAQAIEQSMKQGNFVVNEVIEKDSFRKPVAPFTTSTLQQEAARKLSFSVSQTMRIAQQLYEGYFEIPGYTGGLITYMRTDSFHLSNQALEQAKEVITQEYGDAFALEKPRTFATKSKGAQEAHEAIRPTDLSMKPSQVEAHLNQQQYRLYDLIWKRTVATQMQDAKFAITTYKILAGANKEYLLEVKGQRLLFPGFLKVYTEGQDDTESVLSDKDVLLPKVEKDQELNVKQIHLEQHFTKPPPRFTEASLVKKLEAEGIGRPSTYAPTISTIQDRGYVEKTENKKLKPTDIGEVVNDFLVAHFNDIVNLGFTSQIESNFDEIAQGKQEWIGMMKEFYFPFVERIEEKESSVTRAEAVQERVLGIEPQSGRPISARMGRYGPMIQVGTKDDKEKPKFASIPKGKSIHEVTLKDALTYFQLPRTVGNTKEGEPITANYGRYGSYIKVGKNYFSIGEHDPLSISLETSLEIIAQGKDQKAKSVIHDFGTLKVLRGVYGPYIKKDSKNYRIPKNMNAEELNEEQCWAIIERRFSKKSSQKPTSTETDSSLA